MDNQAWDCLIDSRFDNRDLELRGRIRIRILPTKWIDHRGGGEQNRSVKGLHASTSFISPAKSRASLCPPGRDRTEFAHSVCRCAFDRMTVAFPSASCGALPAWPVVEHFPPGRLWSTSRRLVAEHSHRPVAEHSLFRLCAVPLSEVIFHRLAQQWHRFNAGALQLGV